MGLVYEEKTKVLRRCLFDVQNEVGLGRHEEKYHQGCKLSFEEKGIPFASKPPQPLLLDGEAAYVLYPDFVAWDSITVELKAVPRSLNQSEFVQIFDIQFNINRGLSFLRATGLNWGIAANFGKIHAQFTGLHRSS